MIVLEKKMRFKILKILMIIWKKEKKKGENNKEEIKIKI